jgi:branched-subunit amino acid aminotransferase/4-amino-4-deoxychorismate lyase
VLNVAIVDANGTFHTPPFDGILSGTSVRRALELLSAAGFAVRQGPVSLRELREAQEVMLMGGDSHVFPVTRLDDQSIGTGRPGPVTQTLMRLIADDIQAGTTDHIDVPYRR